jgi:hypothetical protein
MEAKCSPESEWQPHRRWCSSSNIRYHRVTFTGEQETFRSKDSSASGVPERR